MDTSILTSLGRAISMATSTVFSTASGMEHEVWHPRGLCRNHNGITGYRLEKFLQRHFFKEPGQFLDLFCIPNLRSQ